MFLVGENIYFRPLELEDIDNGYLGWLNDANTVRYLDVGRFPTSRRQLEEYICSTDKSKDVVIFAVIEIKSNRHIGNVKLGPIDWINRSAEFGRLVGPGDLRGKGIGTEITQLILQYGFLRLNLNKITAGAVSENVGSIESNKRAGLNVEGVLKEQIFVEGEYRDAIRLGITRARYLQLTKTGE